MHLGKGFEFDEGTQSLQVSQFYVSQSYCAPVTCLLNQHVLHETTLLLCEAA